MIDSKNIVSINQLLNNKTYQVEVTIDLGREIVYKYKMKSIKQYNNLIQV